MIVPDASALLEVLIGRRDAAHLADRLFAGDRTLHAPHLVDIEVAHGLRRRAARGEISPEQGRDALLLFSTLPIAKYPHESLLARIWQLRVILTAYDAAYVALAEGLNATLVTRDIRLAATKGHRAAIEVV